jgi:hypothetical protein
MRVSALQIAVLNTRWSVMGASGKAASFIKETVMRSCGWRVRVALVYGADNFRFALRSLERTADGDLVIIVRRNRYDDELARSLQSLPANRLAQLCVNEEWDGPDISSSRIRSMIKSGDWRAAAAMMTPEVASLLQRRAAFVVDPAKP